MMKSSPTNNENSTRLPSLLMGEGEGGGDHGVFPPHPCPLPRGERGIIRIIFQVMAGLRREA